MSVNIITGNSGSFISFDNIKALPKQTSYNYFGTEKQQSLVPASTTYSECDFSKHFDEAKNKESFVVANSIFTIFKMPDGKLYCRVRDLESGAVNYYPSLEPTSYKTPGNVVKGIFAEENS